MTALTITAHGHAAIAATHAKTFELSEDDDIGPRATCVIGVGARVRGDRSVLDGPVEITVDAAGHRVVVHAEGNPFIEPGGGLVVRRSDFLGADTLAVNADLAAADFDRALVHALQDPATTLTIAVRAAGPPRRRAVFTDAAAPEPDAAAAQAEEVVATTALGQLRACLALVGAADGLLLSHLPKGATARRARLAQAGAATSALVWRGPAAGADARALIAFGHGPTPGSRSNGAQNGEAHDAAHAVDRGEAATRVRPGLPDPDALPRGATLTIALRGTGHGDGPAQDADTAALLAALKAQGVTAKTLRQALAGLPHLAQRWPYDRITKLGS